MFNYKYCMDDEVVERDPSEIRVRLRSFESRNASL